VAVIVVLPLTLTPVAAVPPTVTVAPVTKLVPVIVMPVPPAVDPVAGVTFVTAGAGPTYVKAFVRVATCVSGLVTVTVTTPATCAGVVAVIRVLPLTVTAVAAVPPTPTVAPATKLVPLIVSTVPPLEDPLVGDTLEMVGAGPR